MHIGTTHLYQNGISIALTLAEGHKVSKKQNLVGLFSFAHFTNAGCKQAVPCGGTLYDEKER